jgi:hypothetical protein
MTVGVIAGRRRRFLDRARPGDSSGREPGKRPTETWTAAMNADAPDSEYPADLASGYGLPVRSGCQSSIIFISVNHDLLVDSRPP